MEKFLALKTDDFHIKAEFYEGVLGFEVTLISARDERMLMKIMCDDDGNAEITAGDFPFRLALCELADLGLAIDVVKQAAPQWFTKYELYKLAKEDQ